MNQRSYPDPSYLLVGYDPLRDLPPDHLARLIDQMVDEALPSSVERGGPGQPAYSPRLCAKVLLYGYATGCRSSRQLERLCRESLPYLLLTRGDTPSYRTLCRFRVERKAEIEQIWISLFEVASACGMKRLGHLVVDSSKLRADASPEAVIKAKEYADLLEELERILQENAVVDEREEQEGRSGTTQTGQVVPRDQMREIVRRVRSRREKQKAASETPSASAAEKEVTDPKAVDPPGPALSRAMRRRIEQGIEAIRAAQREARAHLCLTDPDARMMAGGRSHKVEECHSFEAGVDTAAGLLVVGQTTQATSDNDRLEDVVEAAAACEPDGVNAVDADSGFYAGDAIARLLEAGIDTCVPDAQTAGDLHRDQPVGTIREKSRGKTPMRYDAAQDRYECPEGNRLTYRGTTTPKGVTVRVYRAERSCAGCPLASECLSQKGARYRTLKVAEASEVLEGARKRFDEEAHRERYRQRGFAIETVFGFIRGTLGYVRWTVRGQEKVASEGAWVKVAYQFRKIHLQWAPIVREGPRPGGARRNHEPGAARSGRRLSLGWSSA